MSTEALTWAFKVTGLKSSVKFVLVALADNADADSTAWPSVASIVEKTSLDRKTVMKALDTLEEVGFLCDTGLRKGATRQVKIYRLCMEKLPTGQGKLSTEESQKRNSPKNGTVPNFPPKSTKFPAEECQISHERVPNLGHGTVSEPSIEPSGNRQSARATRLPDGWQPNERLKAFCQLNLPRIPVEEVVDKFADYYKSASGSNASKLNWDVAFRNWVRREKEWGQNNPHKQTRFDWRDDNAVLAKAWEFGLSPRAGESWQSFKSRLSSAIEKVRLSQLRSSPLSTS